MERYDLQRGLQELAASPRVPAEPVAPDVVLARVRRTRVLRGAAVGVLGAAAAVGVAFAVQAGEMREQPSPPAVSPTTSASPTPDPTPTSTPTPAPTPETTEEPDPVVPPPVGLTPEGALVEVDPLTGTVLRTIASDPYWTDDLVVDRARGVAYLRAEGDGDGGPAWPGEIHRVSLIDGTSETVAVGYGPAVSPDGARLAYIAYRVDEEPFSEERVLTVRDLTTGETVAEIPDDTCVGCERVLGAPVWTPDGSGVVLPVGWSDSLPGVALYRLAVEQEGSVDDGERLGPANDGDWLADWYGTPAWTADGRLVVPAQEGSRSAWEAYGQALLGEAVQGEQPAATPSYVLVSVDPATGAVLDRVAMPPGSAAREVAIGPAGDGILVVGVRTGPDGGQHVTYRWDGSGLTELGTDLAAVAW